MSPAVKFLIGLVAVLVLGWVWHGPLGNGEAFIGQVENQAKAVVAETGVPGIAVHLGHDPLSRAATLAGPADDFQRNGLGSQKGLTELVADVKGVSTVRWADEPGKSGGLALPLLLETLILVTIAYLIGLGLAWLFWGRRERTSFLD